MTDASPPSSRLAVLLAATLGVALPAAAVEVPLDPYEVDVVDRVAEGTVLHEPEDGRLRGYGFGANITFITDPAWVEKGFVTRSAPEGFKLIAFGLSYTEFGEREEQYPARGAVIADGKRMAIDPADYPFAKTGGAIFAAAVPVGAKSIEFEMESAGTAQRFSLLDAKRVGPQPAILYRDPAAPDVSTDIKTDHIVRASDDQVEAQVALAVLTARLSWFSPRNPLDVTFARTHPDERSSPIDPISNPWPGQCLDREVLHDVLRFSTADPASERRNQGAVQPRPGLFHHQPVPGGRVQGPLQRRSRYVTEHSMTRRTILRTIGGCVFCHVVALFFVIAFFAGQAGAGPCVEVQNDNPPAWARVCSPVP